MHKLCFIFISLVFVPLSIFSQDINKFSRKINKGRYELIGGIGPSGFLGDVGGHTSNATHLINDYNFLQTRFGSNVGICYKDNPKYGFKLMLTVGMVSGNDSLSQNQVRHNRNLNFRSPIIELSYQVEYYLISERNRNVYDIAGLKTKRRKRKVGVYVFAGIGMFYYNPQEKLYENDTWYNIKKYHLEGQGLPGGPKQFSNFNVAIPIGLGFKKVLRNKLWSIGAEFGIRKTFTDYIDGVSTNYYSAALLQKYEGPIAAKLADPNLGKIDGATNAGQERGDPKYKDSYMFLTVNVSYKLNFKQHGRRRITRAKF